MKMESVISWILTGCLLHCEKRYDISEFVSGHQTEHYQLVEALQKILNSLRLSQVNRYAVCKACRA